MPSSASALSSCARTSPIPARCGRTGMNGPSDKHTLKASPSLSWPTASPRAPTPSACRPFCDRLGPADLQAFFDRWIAVIPTPLNTTDQDAGYWWELSMRQIGTSRTLVFDAPRRARGFFEALVADNLDIGRPDEVQLIFGRKIYPNTESPL